jgi:hypothetical protein
LQDILKQREVTKLLMNAEPEELTLLSRAVDNWIKFFIGIVMKTLNGDKIFFNGMIFVKKMVWVGLLGCATLFLGAEEGLRPEDPVMLPMEMPVEMPVEAEEPSEYIEWEPEAGEEPVKVPVQRRRLVGGRGMQGMSLELSAGLGGIRDVEGRVTEQIEGVGFTGALNLNLSDLGVSDDSNSQFFRAKLMNSWVTFYLDYFQGSVSGRGTTDSEIRLNIDGIEFAGRVLDYLLIPEGGTYDLELDTTWIGFGGRLTPLTVNPDGWVRATPWLHFGLQYIELNYNIDAGATSTVQFDPETSRTFAFQGRARSEERALLPEYGLGGEVRFQLWERAGKRVQLVGDVTYTRLDLNNGIGGFNFESSSFRDMSFSYSSVEWNAYVLVPISRHMDFLCGFYLEQVDMRYTLIGDRRVEGLEREIALEYTLYGFRAGLKF